MNFSFVSVLINCTLWVNIKRTKAQYLHEVYKDMRVTTYFQKDVLSLLRKLTGCDTDHNKNAKELTNLQVTQILSIFSKHKHKCFVAGALKVSLPEKGTDVCGLFRFVF